MAVSLEPGDVVVVDFPGVKGIKRRPAVVVSTSDYHQSKRDIIIGAITSQIPDNPGNHDWILTDWESAGLHQPSAYKSFLVTLPSSSAIKIGRLSSMDWQSIQSCLSKSIELVAKN